MLTGKLKGTFAHDALDAHGVDHHGTHDGLGVGGVGEGLGMRLEPLDAGLGVASQDDDVAFAECLVVELSGDSAMLAAVMTSSSGSQASTRTPAWA